MEPCRTDTQAGCKLTLHPWPKPPLPPGVHTVSYLTPKVILQGRRQDFHPQLSKLHLREEKTAVTLARETSVFFIELGKLRHGVEEDLPKATDSGPKRSKIFQSKASISPMGKMRHRESHDLNKATQHSQWQREAEIKGPLMSTAKCSNLNPEAETPEARGQDGSLGKGEQMSRFHPGLATQ